MKPDQEPSLNPEVDAPEPIDDELTSMQGGSGTPDAVNFCACVLRSPEPNS
jgi:hypothetical protein